MAFDPLEAADAPPKSSAGANAAAYPAGDQSPAVNSERQQHQSQMALRPSSPSASVVGTATTAASSVGVLSADHTVPSHASAQTPPLVDAEQDSQRATHTIRLSALRHNYAIVEDAASRQRCSVIVVVKADGYGHGAVETAVHLADYCGADAFAVATLEEGIALRRALSLPAAAAGGGVGPAHPAAAAPAPVGSVGVEFGMMPSSGAAAAGPMVGATALAGSLPPSRRTSEMNPAAAAAAAAPLPVSVAPGIAELFQTPSLSASSSHSSSRLNPSSSSGGSIASQAGAQSVKVGPASAAAAALPPRNRAPRIRILVLGPPVGYPRCFDLYHHHQIEAMVSGPEVARALMEWVANVEERKRTEVQRAAAEFMGEALTRHVGMVRVGLKGTGMGAIEDPTSDQQAEMEEQSDGADEKEDEKKDDSPESGPIGNASLKVDKNDRSKPPRPRPGPSIGGGAATATAGNGTAGGTNAKKAPLRKASQLSENVGASATLSNVTGDDLAKEVRAILLNQQAAVAHLQKQKESEPLQKKKAAVSRQGSRNKLDSEVSLSTDDLPYDGVHATASAAITSPVQTTCSDSTTTQTQQQQSAGAPTTNTGAKGAAPLARQGANIAPFRGIEEAAKLSRDRQLAARARREAEEEARAAEKAQEDDGGDDVIVQPNAVGVHSTGSGSARPMPAPIIPQGDQPPAQQRKRLRWHALVDSGMGRLGFKPDAPTKSETAVADTSAAVIKPRKPRYSETIALIKELHDAEVCLNAPLEFFGMCTHMADATSTSTYTHSQMDRFLTLLDNVRAAGVSVPTVSTDNSAALLTTSLNHFDATRILSQPGARGFVRTGGAIFGQRPTFPQLRAISTLTASVRHVSVIKAGDSVGYDRAYTAPMDVRIATLTIGFADGYPRELGNRVGRVSIQGSTFPVAGNVCMDMMMVELGPAGAAGPGALVAVGDVATLWGPEGSDDDTDGLVRLQDIAKNLKTTQSALTCGLDLVRVERKYKV